MLSLIGIKFAVSIYQEACASSLSGGKVLKTIGAPASEPGNQPDSHGISPTTSRCASNGGIYVGDGYGNDRVVNRV